MPARRYVPFLAALVLIPVLAQRYSAAPESGADGPPTAGSRITAATVYPDRAVVTRTISLDLPSGESTVTFENLPAALTEQSLSASARGVAGAAILDVGALPVFTEAASNEKVRAVEDGIKSIQKDVRALDDRTKILDQQRSSIEKMLAASTTVATGGDRGASRPSFEEWQRVMTYSEESLGKIAKEQASLDTQREDLQAKKSAAERDLNELRGARGRQSKTVRVRVSLTTPGKLNVAIQYAVPNASWTPSYDARLSSADRVVELSYFGVVRNGTGEDWKDISLTLSTARPSLGGAAPELRPWITQMYRRPAPTPTGHEFDTIGGLPMSMVNTVRDGLSVTDGFSPGGVSGLKKESVNSGFSGGFGGGFGGRTATKAPEPPPVVEAPVLAADVESGVSSATFKIPVTVSVAGNNVTQRVGINTAKLMTTLQYQSTPKLLEAAFLSANATNGSDYPLLAGPMNTFLNDTFVATSSLKSVMPGEKFDLALGVDDGITVKRRVVNRFQEDTGLSNKNRRVTYEVQISFTNNKTTTEKLVFREPTPVSHDEKINVKILAPTEKEIGTLANPKEVTREEDGKLVWRLNLEPGKKREFTLKLSIEHPADFPITGLE